MNRRMLRRVLDALGDSAEEVAATLVARQITGTRKDSCRCPLANFLRGAGLDEPEVGAEGPSVGWAGTRDWETDVLPDPVYQFTQRFDAGEFDELDEQVSP